MSEVAGPHGGASRIALPGKTASRRARRIDGRRARRGRGAHVVILGAGTVGANAAKIALGMGARVTLLDIDLDRLRYLDDDVLAGNLNTLYSNHINIASARSVTADALIGSVLITGARAPMLVTRDMLPYHAEWQHHRRCRCRSRRLRRNDASRPTHSEPTFVIDGVLHYGVTNMPGAVPRTSSLALANATLPYAFQLAGSGVAGALMADPALLRGLNTHAGRCTHPAVAETFGLEYVDAELALNRQTADALLPL